MASSEGNRSEKRVSLSIAQKRFAINALTLFAILGGSSMQHIDDGGAYLLGGSDIANGTGHVFSPIALSRSPKRFTIFCGIESPKEVS
jgi:hypothetical protein